MSTESSSTTCRTHCGDRLWIEHYGTFLSRRDYTDFRLVIEMSEREKNIGMKNESVPQSVPHASVWVGSGGRFGYQTDPS